VPFLALLLTLDSYAVANRPWVRSTQFFYSRASWFVQADSSFAVIALRQSFQRSFPVAKRRSHAPLRRVIPTATSSSTCTDTKSQTRPFVLNNIRSAFCLFKDKNGFWIVKFNIPTPRDTFVPCAFPSGPRTGTPSFKTSVFLCICPVKPASNRPSVLFEVYSSGVRNPHRSNHCS